MRDQRPVIGFSTDYAYVSEGERKWLSRFENVGDTRQRHAARKDRHAKHRTENIELNVEELEEVIAPGWTNNHNEMLTVDLEVEELEEVIAPGWTTNHNETLVADTE